jgi:hypothetical protein
VLVEKPVQNGDTILSMDEATGFLESSRLVVTTDYIDWTVIDLDDIRRQMQSSASLDVFFGRYDALIFWYFKVLLDTSGQRDDVLEYSYPVSRNEAI